MYDAIICRYADVRRHAARSFYFIEKLAVSTALICFSSTILPEEIMVLIDWR